MTVLQTDTFAQPCKDITCLLYYREFQRDFSCKHKLLKLKD